MDRAFFLDKAVAFAAGHRPCATCRRADYTAFKAAWRAAGLGGSSAKDMDGLLHDARTDPATGGQSIWHADLDDLPTGTFVTVDDRPHLVTPRGLHAYTPDGYSTLSKPTKKGTGVIVQTPRPLVALMLTGYRPALHHTVRL